MKPIALIRLPYRENAEGFGKITSDLTRLLEGYYVLTTVNSIDKLELEVFNSKDFTDIEFEELKKMIEDTLVTD